jgi:hypothetical protein
MLKLLFKGFNLSLFKRFIIVILIISISESAHAQEKSIILGRPTDTSIRASIMFDQNVQYYIIKKK